jgi:flagellar protein FliS
MVALSSAIESYSKHAVASEAVEASPHRIIQMLMDGFMERIAYAKGHIERGDLPEKSKYISKAIGIVNGLRSCLDMEKGSEIARNLNDLYDYMNRRLIEANSNNDIAILSEVQSLMAEVKQGWDAIPEEYKYHQKMG